MNLSKKDNQILTPDFRINANGEISKAFLDKGISYFSEACAYTRDLSYGRNADKDDIFCVLAEERGTCSTKHALLKRLADENGYTGIRLFMGLFAMTEQNVPQIGPVLKENGLTYMPEVHNYLKYKGKVLDFTKSAPIDFLPGLIEEKEIGPAQVTDHKVVYHKEYIAGWALTEDANGMTADELWAAREQCIRAMTAER